MSKGYLTGCILYDGKIDVGGYGYWYEVSTKILAHRRAWEEVHGPIPSDMTIDHLCCVRHCHNVDHLEVVTRAENSRRQGERRTGCKWGHPYEGDNYYWTISATNGRRFRFCRVCNRLKARKRRA